MSCDKPEQLSLDTQPRRPHLHQLDGYAHGSKQFQHFVIRLWQLLNKQPMRDEEVDDTPIVTELHNYAKFNDFPLLASYVKQMMKIGFGTDVAPDSPEWKGIPLRILSCFSKAFRGDEVGHIGRDILIPLLGHDCTAVRAAAVDTLERWIEYDDDGMWLEMVSGHLEREMNPNIKRQCEFLVGQYEEESNEDMILDCPECNEGHLLTMSGCWYCDNCGNEWSYDPIEHEYDLEEEEIDEEGDDPAELKEFLTVHRAAANNLRAVVETKNLPLLLAGVLDIHPHLTLDLIESLNIGHLSVRSTSLGLCLHPLQGGAGHLLRAWDARERFCFSIEPTATDDRWLVFMRY